MIRICSGMATLALLCILLAVGLSLSNHALRQRVDERQQVINGGLAMSQVSSRLVSALVAVAIRDNDEQVKRLLAERGISIGADQPSGTSPPAKK